MTTTADESKRVLIPQARPGQVYTVQADAEGVVTLIPVKPAEEKPMKARLEQHGGYTVVVTDRPVDEQVIRELLADFP